MKTGKVEPQEWWAGLSEGERRLICSVMQMLRGAKRSTLVEVARAAVKWERGIGCFIKVRLMNENPRRRRVVDSGWVKVEGRQGAEEPGTERQDVRPTSCRSTARSQPGAAPGRG